ncbi:MAG: DUF448 domain-containing protein [Acidobacteria bacterium]|nr:DUF448 domain-containing protein [Acidobacteriota bacterium]
MACRRRRPDHELVRLGRTSDGDVIVGRGPGRGAWICPSEECLARLRRSALERAWRSTISEEAVERVRERVGTQIPGSVKE